VGRGCRVNIVTEFLKSVAITRSGTARAARTAGEEIVSFFVHSAFAVVCGLFLARLVSVAIVRVYSTLGVHHVPDFFGETFGPFF
jgi:hypothetical protein